MNECDRAIMTVFFRLQEIRTHRLRLERIWFPERFRWNHSAPSETWSTAARKEALKELGLDPESVALCQEEESWAKEKLEELAESHELWEHFKRLRGFGRYLCGCFVAAAGDISRPGTVSSFWRGMGLGLVDGQVPRRVRGRKGQSKLPCPPHVSLVGEQIRQQILRSGGKLAGLYRHYRRHYDERYPDRPKILNHKAALRAAQKILYACLWREWRLARGLPAPEPYAFDILKHGQSGLITIQDLYDN